MRELMSIAGAADHVRRCEADSSSKAPQGGNISSAWCSHRKDACQSSAVNEQGSLRRTAAARAACFPQTRHGTETRIDAALDRQALHGV